MKIYFTSDTHGHYFPTDYMDKEKKAVGLLAMEHGRLKDENTLLMDAGDTLQGSPFAYYRQLDNDSKTAGIIASKLSYDYITLGNHDFNYGYDYLKNYVNNFSGKVICSNLEDLRGELKNVYPYYITEVEGKKIGIVGAVTDWVNVWEQEKNKEGYRINKVLESVKKAYENIKDCDYRICIYHGGMEFDINTFETVEKTDENVSGKMADIMDLDLILTGHQHRLIPYVKYKNTVMVQPGSHASKYLELDIDLDTKDVNVKVCDFTSDIYEDKWEEELKLESETQEKLDKKITTLDKSYLPEDRLSMAINGSSLADFINQIQLDASKADVSVVSFANEISGFSKDVTMREVLNTYKFSNTLKVFEIDVKTLKKAIEHNYEFVVFENGEFKINDRFINPKLELYNFDFFGGITFDIDLKSNDKKVSNIYLNSIKLDDSEILKIVMNSYRATGIAGFDMYKNLKLVKEINTEMTDIIIEYLKRMEN
ncbi:bifunctional metallophosphatase/5'-nucleotidase [Oceanivirga miroungae]|uniref:Adenosine synthase A n=1 Tax=Oceanivirga miroungae TaxID=1130046 RepID=A0A6I8M7N7_9FUSO|nr:bifunctional UDP-sugar hydrolase/5'-nucleotidase [Oceanivirga miroungae]VWL85919.1 Adenosine synthase A [Oceanivirga miroungae]